MVPRSMLLTLSTHPAPRSPAAQLLDNAYALGEGIETTNSEPSSLLKSIRATISEPVLDPSASGHVTIRGEEELSWSRNVVVLSQGGVIRQQWRFVDEIRHCCFAMFSDPTDTIAGPHTHRSKGGSFRNSDNQSESSLRTPFGPFMRFRHQSNRPNGLESPGRMTMRKVICVILRSYIRMYDEQGGDHMFPLPFLVKEAWGLGPMGVLLQREWDSGETSDSQVPLHFTVTDAIAEPKRIGCASLISRAFDDALPPIIFQHDISLPNTNHRTLRSPSIQENVCFVAANSGGHPVIVTYNEYASSLTIWIYAYAKGTVVPSMKTKFRSDGVHESAESAPMDASDLGKMQGKVTASPHVDYWWQPLFSMPIATTQFHRFECALFRETTSSAHLAVLLPTNQAAIIRLQENATTSAHHWTAELSHMLPAASFSAVASSRHDSKDLLIVRPDRSLSLMTPTQEFRIELSPGPNLHNPPTPSHDTLPSKHVARPGMRGVEATLHAGAPRIVSAALHCTHNCTQIVLDSLRYALPDTEYLALHHKFLHQLTSKSPAADFREELSWLASSLLETLGVSSEESAIPEDPWSSLSRHPARLRFGEDVALHSLTQPPVESHRTEQSLPRAQAISPSVAPVMFCLHLIGQALMMDLDRHADLMVIAALLIHLSQMVQCDWADYWIRHYPDAQEVLGQFMHCGPFPPDLRLPPTPPDLAAYLSSALSTYSKPQTQWMKLQDIPGRFGLPTSGEVTPLTDPLPLAQQLIAVYDRIRECRTLTVRERAEQLVVSMVNVGLTLDVLQRIPFGTASPLREALRTCQLYPPKDWPTEAYILIDRKDLAQMKSGGPPQFGFGFGDAFSQMNHLAKRNHPPRIQECIEQAIVNVTGPPDGSGVEIQLDHFTAIRFGADRRLQEVCLMLQGSRIPSINMADRPEATEHDMSKEQQAILFRVAERTWALAVGRGMLTFGSISTPHTDARVVPKIELSVRLMPQNSIITPDPAKLVAMADSKAWADFHNAAAAGLRISPLSDEVDSSWIQFIRPTDMTPEHAGYLLALGLTGHLASLMTWHMFSYLTPKHDHTSVAILLGISAARLGTEDEHVLKILAVHTPGLLPTRKVDLNVPLITQAAALMGLGLLCFGTGNRHYATLALGEISRPDLYQPSMGNEHREATALSAAFAFGMIMIGKGSAPAGLGDLETLSRLRLLIHGDANSHPLKRSHHSPFDPTLTSPGATLALAFMFLKSNRSDISEVLHIPTTLMGLAKIPPSFLLLRTLGRWLIMWDSISPSIEWVTSQIPRLQPEATDASQKPDKFSKDALDLAEYNVIAGACFALALKFAGTASEAAYLVIVHFYDTFFNLQVPNSAAFDHRIKKAALRDGLNLLGLSLAMVMAGTGEVNCLRRFRFAHGQIGANGRYGSHLALHMAMGLLFLGGGRYTLGTSDLAITAMVIAFYPRFPSAPNDNRGHLQALRHLWVIAVEPRCLIARDVDTGEITYLPVKIKVQEGSNLRSNHLLCPTLIPNIDLLQTVRIDSPRYWTYSMDLREESHRDALLRHQTLFIRRRTGFLSYSEDPRGCRSIFVRTGGSAGDAGLLDFPTAFQTVPPSVGELHRFIMSFSNDSRYLTFADRFCHHLGNTQREKALYGFCQAALIECLTLDKPQLLLGHLWCHLVRTTDPRKSGSHAMMVRNLLAAEEFYSTSFYPLFGGHIENVVRAPLFRPTLIVSTRLEIAQTLVGSGEEASISTAIQSYLAGKDLAQLSKGTRRLIYLWIILSGIPASSTVKQIRSLSEQTLMNPLETIGGPTSRQGVEAVSLMATVLAKPSVGSDWDPKSLTEIVGRWLSHVE